MVNQAKLDQMLSNLGSFIRTLKELSKIPGEEFLSDPNKVGNAKYHFIIAIECCIDLANHIISSESFRFPETNADSFKVLVEQKLLPSDRLAAWTNMASFRNRLVHLYWDVDDAKVCEYLQDSLHDLQDFRERIAQVG